MLSKYSNFHEEPNVPSNADPIDTQGHKWQVLRAFNFNACDCKVQGNLKLFPLASSQAFLLMPL